MSLSCIKKNTILSTKQDEALWFFWKENMKLKEKWIQYIPDKKMNNTTCYNTIRTMFIKTPVFNINTTQKQTSTFHT